MRIFFEAFKDVDSLDMLFYTHSEINISDENIRAYEKFLRKKWHPNLTLFLCPSNVGMHSSKWRLFSRSIWNIYEHPEFSISSGEKQIAAFENCLKRQPCAVFIHRLYSIAPVLLSQQSLPPVYFDLDDIEHKKLFRSTLQPPRSFWSALHYLRVPSLLLGECKAIRSSTYTFVCSDEDKNYLANRLRLSGVVSLPNSTEIPEAQHLTAQKNLLFIGNYSYLPNINAANLLIKKIFPLIREVTPNAHLIIAGSNPENIPSYKQEISGIEFTGFVEDLEALYSRTRVVCCPIFAGGGTRVKLIEAAAYGKAIVSTKIGAEGLALRNGRDFLCRNSNRSFSRTCSKLLDDSVLCEKLGENARKVAINCYDKSKIVADIQSYIINNKVMS